MNGVSTAPFIGALALVIGALALTGCANAGGGGGGGGADADPNAPDADPTAPDANPNAPDADPNAPDADPTAPDARPASGADANSCPKTPCDLYEQCGCPTGEACDLGANPAAGDTDCRAVAAQGTETATCARSEDCAGGYVCLGSNPGQCRKWCQNDTECSGPGALCLLGVTSGGMDVPNATTCSKDCDPSANTTAPGCPAAMGCHVFVDDPDGTFGNGDERFLTDCTGAPATGGGDGVTCANSNDCAIGFDCINLTSGGVTTMQCKQNCVYPTGACQTGACNRFGAPRPVIGGVEYGVCI